MQVLGIILCLGGCAHSLGVMHFYFTHGIPDINRVLLDVWIAEAQILGGALYLSAYCAIRSGRPWRAAAIYGALTVGGYAGPYIPVLLKRAPILFQIAPIVYLSLSLLIFIRATSAPDARSRCPNNLK